MAVRELRICDVCQTDYTEDNAAWMVMAAVNAPEEMGPVQYDFCSFDCLHSWVTTDDEETDEVPALNEAEKQAMAEYAAEAAQREVEVPDYVRKAAETPLPTPTGMTLMDALANGLKPDGPR